MNPTLSNTLKAHQKAVNEVKGDYNLGYQEGSIFLIERIMELVNKVSTTQELVHELKKEKKKIEA